MEGGFGVLLSRMLQHAQRTKRLQQCCATLESKQSWHAWVEDVHTVLREPIAHRQPHIWSAKTDTLQQQHSCAALSQLILDPVARAGRPHLREAQQGVGDAALQLRARAGKVEHERVQRLLLRGRHLGRARRRLRRLLP